MERVVVKVLGWMLGLILIGPVALLLLCVATLMLVVLTFNYTITKGPRATLRLYKEAWKEGPLNRLRK